jgi:hypothetical protein
MRVNKIHNRGVVRLNVEGFTKPRSNAHFLFYLPDIFFTVFIFIPELNVSVLLPLFFFKKDSLKYIYRYICVYIYEREKKNPKSGKHHIQLAIFTLLRISSCGKLQEWPFFLYLVVSCECAPLYNICYVRFLVRSQVKQYYNNCRVYIFVIYNIVSIEIE